MSQLFCVKELAGIGYFLWVFPGERVHHFSFAVLLTLINSSKALY
jgi:hypothetical protein